MSGSRSIRISPYSIDTEAGLRQILAAAGGQAAYLDALLVATASEGRCTTIPTEAMTDGQVMGGVRVLNPFGRDTITAAATAL